MLKKQMSAIAIFAGLTLATGLPVAMAEEGAKAAVEDVKENAKEMGRDVKKGAKKAGRAIKDSTCRMIKGKMQCAAEKMGHKIENGVDEVKDKADGK